MLSFDLNENINQDEAGADDDAAGSDDEDAFIGKVSLCIMVNITLVVKRESNV